VLTLPGYTFTASVAETAFSQLYRGTRDADGKRVVAKIIRSERPTQVELARIKHEMSILRSLADADVVQAIDLHMSENRPVLVLDDLGEHSVSGLVGQRLPVRKFLELACSMASAIATVHRHRIIHKDLKPGHFLIVGDAFRTKIIGFGLAARLPEETPAIQPELLEGTLAYLSPEQTGRVNRLVDLRSDQYALGVCFYQLLTGVLPFQATDPLELIHSHIARLPPTPQSLRPDVPEVVSDIIMKLLSKVAEDRYRSDAGLEADLSACLQGLSTDGQLTSFRLGRRDFSSEPQIPQRLYGRELQTERLFDAFSRVRAGAAELLLISGSSGVGKSALWLKRVESSSA
jgi:serine/threonine protein kinase